MNLISKHIAYLILTCREVAVPGLGTFSASYERATFDPEDKIFYPSRIRINFSPKQNIENFRLESSLERQMNIKESEANRLIREYVIKIRNIISSRNYCRLEGIGYLISDPKGNLSLKDTFWRRHRFPAIPSMCI